MILLHLSDIHFRNGVVGSAMDPYAHIRKELLRDVETQCARIGASPGAILVSGDIAFSGHDNEYAYASKWLDKLCKCCGAPITSVFVVPGNHDIDRGVTSKKLIKAIHRDIKDADGQSLENHLREYLTDKDTGRLLYKSLSAYNNFSGQFFCDLLPPERTIAKRKLTLNDGSILQIIGLNSTFVSSSDDKELDLFVDPACFQFTRQYGVEYLVLCHHPYRWLRQGESLKAHLNDVARVQLFGHAHTNRIELNRDWVRVAASAAHPDKTEPGWEPGYNLINVNIDGTGDERYLEIDIHVRVWQANPGQFRSKMDKDLDVFRHKIKLEGWTPPVSVTCQLAEQPVAGAVPPEDTLDKFAEGDAMEPLRDIAVRYFKLTLSKKSEIAGKLNLLEEGDVNQPDFERFRQVLIRARQRNLIQDLDQEVKTATVASR